MSDGIIARRAQDIQAGLRGYEDPIVTSTVPITTLIGRAALLAVHLRGLERITNLTALFRLAHDTLGITSGAIAPTLKVLEEAAWIRVSPNCHAPRVIEENIPRFQSLYVGLSEQWESYGPHELDRASIALVDALSKGPALRSQVESDLGLGEDGMGLVRDVALAGGYVKKYGKPGSELLYSPLYVEENPEALLNFMDKNRARYAEMHNVLELAQSNPGLPVAALEATHPIVLEMVEANAICAPAVTSAGGTHSFLFPPLRYQVDRAIIQKARVLLSCVRYGQSFGGVTKISDPKLLLERLRDRQLIGAVPHSQIKSQYSPASDLGIGFIEDHGGRYSFRMYDTEDNAESVKLAIRLVQGATEAPAQKLIEPDDIVARISETRIVLPEENRLNARAAGLKIKSPDSEAARKAMREMMDDLRGVHRVR